MKETAEHRFLLDQLFKGINRIIIMAGTVAIVACVIAKNYNAAIIILISIFVLAIFLSFLQAFYFRSIHKDKSKSIKNIFDNNEANDIIDNENRFKDEIEKRNKEILKNGIIVDAKLDINEFGKQVCYLKVHDLEKNDYFITTIDRDQYYNIKVNQKVKVIDGYERKVDFN